MKIMENYIISGEIVLETGMHIGGLKETVEIGGADSPVIRTYLLKDKSGKNVRTLPYIPGSSLKGKIRSLLEYMYSEDIAKIESTHKNVGNITTYKLKNNEEIQNVRELKKRGFIKIGDSYIKYPENCLIPKVFGVPAEEDADNLPRAIFRDAMPTRETIEWWDSQGDIIDGAEIKPENSINRLTSRANPRQFERVPAGSKFKFEIVLTIYDGDGDSAKEYMKTLLSGMKLLEDNYIGGSGTRGYGKIKFENLKITKRSSEFYANDEGKEEIIYSGEGDNDGLSIGAIIKKIQ